MRRSRRPPRLRFVPAASGTLEAVASGLPPEGFTATDAVRTAFRDDCYDTEDGELARRGASVRIRHRPDGRRTLHVRTDGGGKTVRASVEPDAAPFTGDSAPEHALRALVDPERLAVRLEIATDRWLRRFTGPAGGVRVACDRRRVRGGPVRAEVEEVVVQTGPAARRLVGALRKRHGLAREPRPPLETARLAVAAAEMAGLECAIGAARRVAVLVMADGLATLLKEGGALRVPSGPGAGEEACRQVLRGAGYAPGARVRLLGSEPGSSVVEVWLAEAADPAAEGTVRLPLHEVLASVGSPALRDRDTLAALHVAARAGIAHQVVADVAGDAEAWSVLAGLPEPRAAGSDELPPGGLLNMELSLLAFNRRVLELAADAGVPLLERLRFLSIFGGNLDEFFRVRVAGFKRQVALGSAKRTMDGVTPEEQLDAIGTRARLLVGRAYALLREELLPELGRSGFEVVPLARMAREEREHLRERWEREIRPLVAPLAAGPGHPFPQVRNLRPALVASLTAPSGEKRTLGIVELPDGVPRFLPLPGGRRFVALEEVLRDGFPRLYPGLEVGRPRVFRVTRSAELHLDQSRVEDLLHAVEEQVRKRRFRPVVRVEVEAGMPAELRDGLLRELRFEAPANPSPLGEGDVYEVDGPVDLRELRDLAQAVEPEAASLVYPPEPELPAPLEAERPIWDQLRERDVLVSFPEDSFRSTVERLVLDAAADPEVMVIKLALYRTNPRSDIVEALTRAAADGKQVFALVELTARFDEMHNIRWARYLRSYGIHVVYGLPGRKVHAKIALVVRRENGLPRAYGYVGTGNLNASTAAHYTDFGLLTADPVITEELNGVFDLLTGAAPGSEFHSLLVAPLNMRTRFLELIGREEARGPEGRIAAKMNGLADREMIAALYAASRAGVRIELLVRGICALRPGVPGLSESIRVYSAVGRHLEHGRFFRFGEGADAEYFIGSADWRTRNLSRRVEVAIPIRDARHRERLDAKLAGDLERPNLWELGADGSYHQRPERAPHAGEVDAHPGTRDLIRFPDR
jgi:polyphosphate kinase